MDDCSCRTLLWGRSRRAARPEGEAIRDAEAVRDPELEAAVATFKACDTSAADATERYWAAWTRELDRELFGESA
jgi:hypothetical protein